MRSPCFFYGVLFGLASWVPAVAGEVPAGHGNTAGAPHVLAVGLKAGVGLPQLNSALQTSFHVQIEGLYLAPFWGSRLGVVTTLGYSQPGASGSEQDARLPAGEYSWEMTQRQTTWDLGVLFRLMEWRSDWNVGFSAGHRLLFLSTLTDGQADGEPFGQHDEKATLPGFFLAVQGEYALGPGRMTAEISLAGTMQDLYTTGDVAVLDLGILLGYRFDFEI
ncbi:MAG: hypothetical protein JXR96_14805 [Deltaproteobacteria bacterium]|nr:hypothetical protein [Deltaproteobacteria bacterium]